MLAEKKFKSETITKSTGKPNRQLVLFDFDGTITTRDTLAEFMIHYHGKTKYYIGLGLLSPVLVLWAAKVLENWKAKQYFLSYYLKDKRADEFKAKCTSFVNDVLPSLIRPAALAEIEKHQKNGATVAVVSASAQDWVKPWCDKHDLLCLATKLEVRDNRITGKISGKNCHGAEKVCRIKETFTLSDYTEIIAYGDSSGDKEMLAIAHQKFYRPFRENQD